jgi:HAD superfamily hydrolase (TIGR01509 family)
MPVRAVLFDLDGTLVDSERQYGLALAAALARGLDIHITDVERDYIVGRSWVDIYANLAARYGKALTWSRERVIEETVVERTQMNGEGGVAILPGARAAIERFAPYPRAIVTGSSHLEARECIATLGVEGVFDLVVACEDYPRSKPAPDGYLLAAQTLGVDPRDCLVLEDSAAGIAAGLAAGATVVAIRAGNFSGHDQSAAHGVVDTLDDVTVDLIRALREAPT